MKSAFAKISFNTPHLQRKESIPFFSKETDGSFFSKSNEAATSFFNPATIQPKLTIGHPNDKYEVEADRMADAVVQRLAMSPDPGSYRNGNESLRMVQSNGVVRSTIQAKCAECEEEEKLQKQDDPLSSSISRLHRKPIFEGNGEMPEEDLQTKLSMKPTIQTKCDACREEEIHPKKEQQLPENEINTKTDSENSGVTAGTEIQSRIHGTKGKGSPLSPEVRHSMGSAFGSDFSNVRVHTGSYSTEMNTALGAQAFTYGADIYFNDSNYNTSSANGQRLLAHELTHVVQNGNSEPVKLRRRTQKGFEIRGIYPNAGAYPNTIFYEMGSAMIPPSEWYKVGNIATTFAGKPIKITGTASEEGEDVSNLTTINRRISGVHQVLQNAGHRLTHTRNPQPGVTAGNKDYRQARNVEVEEMVGTLPPGGTPPATVNPCDTTLNPNPEVEPCGVAILTAFPLGLVWIINALSKLKTPDAATTAQASILFPGIPIPTISIHVASLLGKYSGLLSSHVCHNHCDPACSRPARMNTGTGIMTVCPGFLNEPSTNERAETLIHESLHATPGVMSDDIAYLTTRLITSLTGAQALRNTDSYVLLIFSLNGMAPSALPPTDVFDAAITPAEKTVAQNALAFLEQWLLWSQYDTSLLYSAINSNIGRAGGWDPADSHSASLLHKISPHFALTDPGAAAPYATVPVKDDRSKMAGMFDRYNRMMFAVYQRNLDLHKSGVSRWQPGIGTRIDLANVFFTLGPEAATRFLLALLIRADGTVPASMVNAYVEGANEFRKRWGAGP